MRSHSHDHTQRHNKKKEDKFDKMEPLIFGPQPPRKKSTVNRSSQSILSPSPQPNNTHKNGRNSSPNLSSNGHKSPSTSKSPRADIIAEKVNNISKIKLPSSEKKNNNNSLTPPQNDTTSITNNNNSNQSRPNSRNNSITSDASLTEKLINNGYINSGYDGNLSTLSDGVTSNFMGIGIERNGSYNSVVSDGTTSHRELEIKDTTKRVNDLMNDIWWLLDQNDELKLYKKDGHFYNDFIILFESFASMKNNGDKLCYTLSKLLGQQIFDFAMKQSLIYVKKHEYWEAVKAYNVIIRYYKLLKLHESGNKSYKKLNEYFLQRSQCYFKLGEYQLALFDAERSYKIDSMFEKGYIMHGKILMTLHRYQLAKSIYVKGYALNGKYKKKLSNGIQYASKELKMREESKKIDYKHLEFNKFHNIKISRMDDEQKIIENQDDDNDDDDKKQNIKKSMTQQMRREIDTECNKWNKIVYGKDSNCVYMEGMKPCFDIKKCECTKRVIFLMQLYVKWCQRYINYISLNELIEKICGKCYYYKSYHRKDLDKLLLMNDYIHIIDKHLKINIGDDNVENNLCKNYNINWKYLTKQLGICENNSCLLFKRHFRNKNICITSIQERKKKYFGYLDSKYISLIQLFDQIHCHITHCNPFVIEKLYDSIFDIYIKGNADDQKSDLKQLEDELNDEYDSYIEISDDLSSQSSDNNHIEKTKKIKQKINRERLNYIKKYDTNAGHNSCLHSKFISHVDKKFGMQFGVQFVYWQYFKFSAIYCKPKYLTLKYELLNNNIYSINKYIWNDVLNKAKWIQLTYKCKKEMKAKDKGLENKKLKIAVGLKISLSHLIVLLLMSNYIELRNKFIETACNFMEMDEKNNELEMMKDIKIRNSEIGNFCKLLYECILFFGEEMKKKQYFYHGIDHRLLFNDYHLTFKQPISTTSSLLQIKYILLQNLYKKKQTIILKWGLSDSYGCPYFNISWLSNNPYEQEIIFFNCKLGLYDILYFDINYGDETKKILQSNYKYIQSLILFEKIVKGYFFSSNYDSNTRQLYEKIITKMIENFLHPTNNNNNKRERSPSLSSSKNSRRSDSYNSSIFTKIVENVVSKITQNKNNNDDDKRNSNIEIPSYIQDLFGFYCENIDELWLIKSEISSLSDKLREYFVDSKCGKSQNYDDDDDDDDDNKNNKNNDVYINSNNHDSYGSFLRMIETNHINEYKEKGQLFINFVDEYVWYIGKNKFNQFLSLKCNQSMVGPKVHVEISYDINDDNIDNNNNNINNKYNDYIIFEPNCFRSLKFAPSYGAFGLTIIELPKYIQKIKFEYQIYCKQANYILLVPSTNKWYKKGDNVGFKSFKSQIVTSNITKEFSYRFTIKIIQIQKTNK